MATYFPLAPLLEDLETPHGPSVFCISSAATGDVLPEDATSALRQFLRIEEQLSGSTARHNGLSMIEAIYLCLKNAKSTSKPLSFSLLKALFTSLVLQARCALKDASNADAGIRKRSQNVLRSCVFFLCHGVAITESCLATKTDTIQLIPNFGAKWTELKVLTMSLICALLGDIHTVFDSSNDKTALEDIARCTVLSCLRHQKWSDRGAEARVQLHTLKKRLLDVLSFPFLRPCGSKSAGITFESLVSLCTQNRPLTSFVVDLISLLLLNEGPAGISLLGHFANRIVERSTTSKAEAKTLGQDEIESSMGIFSEFSSTKDAVVLVSLFLDQLLITITSERAATRKFLADVIGSCLQQASQLTHPELQALQCIHGVLLRDRDASCRVRALSSLGELQWLPCCHQEVILGIACEITKRCTDKNKSVRIRALHLLKAFVSPSLALDPSIIADSGAIETGFMLLAISTDSSYFCKDTAEAAGIFLCSAPFESPAFYKYIEAGLNFNYGSFNQEVFWNVLQYYLSGYEQWSRFLVSASELTVMNLRRIMETSFKNKQEKMVHSAFNVLKGGFHDEVRCLGASMVIALFSSSGFCLDERILICLAKFCFDKLTAAREDITARLLEWTVKALAAVLQCNPASGNAAASIIKSLFVPLKSESIDSVVDCLYALNNPFSFVKLQLETYEKHLEVLDREIPMKLAGSYITFIGDISRNYSLACAKFLQRFREASNIAPSSTINETDPQFNYLREEEQRIQEEDAVLRFSQMLVDGNSVPGCYVPLLRQLSTSEDFPVELRVAAIASLEKFFLASPHLANAHKDLIEVLLQSSVPEVKMPTLVALESLILSFPNDFLPLLPLVVSSTKEPPVKHTAFQICAHLLLQQKLKPEQVLETICEGLCDEDLQIKGLIVFLLRKLASTAGRSKYKLILDIYKHGASLHGLKLIQAIVDEVLDAVDLQSDELALSVIQALAYGQMEAAYFSGYLSPSSKALATLHSALSSCPPRIAFQGDAVALKSVVQFVHNHKRHGTGAPSRELVTTLLELLESKAGKRRRNQMKSNGDNSCYDSIEDYDEAVRSFKSTDSKSNLLCEILSG